MLDDDIQYMGTRPALRVVSDSPFSTRKTIHAVVLHIEKLGLDSPYELIFSRACTDVVHIGRLSSTELEQWHGDPATALFKCAVVSRSHAKIVFSDSGHAYLIDLKSHHGTHVRKPGETVSKMLVPETPVQLAEGDIITFGKSVGSDADLVRPVVARVELRYRRSDNGLKPLITPTRTVVNLDISKGSPKSSSGRFGLYDSSSSSDDGSSAMSDHDSDIEEIPVSGANAVPLQPRGSHIIDPVSNLSRAFEVLKRFIPPVHHATPPFLFKEQSQSEANEHHNLPAISDPLQDLYFESPLYDPYSPSPMSCSPRSISPMFNMPSPRDYPCMLPLSTSDGVLLDSDAGSPWPDTGNDSDDIKCEGRLPDSPTPPSDRPVPTPEQANEPNIIGAYPKSRSSSPNLSAAPPFPVNEPRTLVKELVVTDKDDDQKRDGDVGVDSDVGSDSDDADADADDAVEDSDPEAGAEADAGSGSEAEAEVAGARRSAEPNAFAPVPKEFDHAGENPASAASNPQALEPSDPSDVSLLRIGLTQLQGDVEKLQIHRRKYKERFNTNVDKLSDKLSDMDGRIADVHAQYNVLCDQVAEAMDVDIPDLQGQVEALQDQMDAISPILNMTSEPLMHEREDVKASIQALHSLVADMRILRDITQKEMTAALEAVRAARDAALVTITAHAEAPQVKEKTPVLTSSKRKRSDEQDEDDSVGNESQSDCKSESESESELKNCTKDKHRSVQDVGVGASDDGVADVMMAEGIPIRQFTTLVPDHSGIDVPSPKRARRLGAVVLQTATAVTVGAVATWSALAFS